MGPLGQFFKVVGIGMGIGGGEEARPHPSNSLSSGSLKTKMYGLIAAGKSQQPSYVDSRDMDSISY